MKIRSCHGGMPDRLSGRTERRDKKNDVVIMSKLQPFLRATPSARGTFGVSMKPKRSSTRRKDVADWLDTDPLCSRDMGPRFDLHGEYGVLLMQHFVVLEAVKQRGRRAIRVSSEKHGRPGHASWRFLFQNFN